MAGCSWLTQSLSLRPTSSRRRLKSWQGLHAGHHQVSCRLPRRKHLKVSALENGKVRCLHPIKIYNEQWILPPKDGLLRALDKLVLAKVRCTRLAKHFSIHLMVLHKILEHAEKIAVVGGVLVALATFRSQTRQVRVSNSYLLLDAFARDISQEDLRLLESVLLSTYESCGAQRGCFVIFNGGKREQHPIMNLFIAQGRGLVVDGSLEFIPKLSSRHSNPAAAEPHLFLGSIRSLAEQLNIISYETINGQIEKRVVHYRLGHCIESLGYLLEQAVACNTGQDSKLSIRFKWLIKLRRILQKRGYPSRSFASGC